MLRALRSRLFLAQLALFALLTSVSSVAAQATDSPDDRAQSFQAVTGAVKEDVPGGPLLLIAYALVWLVVFFYVFRMARLQRGVQDDLSRLERVLAHTDDSKV
jgi:CcmD family protein